LRGGLLRGWALKSGGDDDAPEFDGHVVIPMGNLTSGLVRC
jgi:hypothetical protein